MFSHHFRVYTHFFGVISQQVPQEFNVYWLFRLLLLVVTLYDGISVIRQILQYKQYYDKLPAFLQKYLKNQGSDILLKQAKNHRRDLMLNLILLVVLLGLNGILWLL